MSDSVWKYRQKDLWKAISYRKISPFLFFGTCFFSHLHYNGVWILVWWKEYEYEQFNRHQCF